MFKEQWNDARTFISALCMHPRDAELLPSPNRRNPVQSVRGKAEKKYVRACVSVWAIAGSVSDSIDLLSILHVRLSGCSACIPSLQLAIWPHRESS
jgi:hypothetical protein